MSQEQLPIRENRKRKVVAFDFALSVFLHKLMKLSHEHYGGGYRDDWYDLFSSGFDVAVHPTKWDEMNIIVTIVGGKGFPVGLKIVSEFVYVKSAKTQVRIWRPEKGEIVTPIGNDKFNIYYPSPYSLDYEIRMKKP